MYCSIKILRSYFWVWEIHFVSNGINGGYKMLLWNDENCRMSFANYITLSTPSEMLFIAKHQLANFGPTTGVTSDPIDSICRVTMFNNSHLCDKKPTARSRTQLHPPTIAFCPEWSCFHAELSSNGKFWFSDFTTRVYLDVKRCLARLHGLRKHSNPTVVQRNGTDQIPLGVSSHTETKCGIRMTNPTR